METTILLSRAMGVLLIIASLAFMIRQRHYAGVIDEFIQARAMRMMLAFVELTAGVFIILLHNEWSSLAAGIITFIGWMMAIESTLYLFISDTAFAKLIRAFNKPAWFIGGGLLGLVAGLYLALVGFGFIT